jgi:hypothetical protein
VIALSVALRPRGDVMVRLAYGGRQGQDTGQPV